ncbi:MAG: hypothetical protein ISR51_09825 [Rhodospirillales bacterium]|nr:hypothetical protein [Rhodospirillales bacterium]
MRRIVKPLVALSVLTVGLAGWFLGGASAWSQTAAPEDQVRVTSLKKLPWDATLVLSACVLTMRGRDEALNRTPVVVAPAAKSALQERRFRYEGFELTGFTLTAYGEPSSSADAVLASALLYFTDPAGRRATVSLAAEYGLAGKKIEITSAEAVTLPPPKPDVRLLIVLAANVSKTWFSSNPTRTGLLQKVEEKALTPEAARNLPPGPRDFYVFAFFRDRLAPDAGIRLLVSPNPGGMDGKAGETTDLIFNGWHVPVMRGRGSLGSKEEWFVKAVYTPGHSSYVKDRTPRLVGVVSSNLNTVSGKN